MSLSGQKMDTRKRTELLLELTRNLQSYDRNSFPIDEDHETKKLLKEEFGRIKTPENFVKILEEFDLTDFSLDSIIFGLNLRDYALAISGYILTMKPNPPK